MDDEPAEVATGMERRTFVRRAAVVAGATVWATPTVQSLMAPAFASGTGECPPGRLFRFKFDVNDAGTGGTFDSGDASGGGANWCLPTGYADATPVDGSGCIELGHCITVTMLTPKTAVVTVPPGCRIEDLQAKAGSSRNGECEDAEAITGSTAEVSLQDKEISFVAGVVCC